MNISTTSNILTTIESKVIESKKSQSQSIPYFFANISKEKNKKSIKSKWKKSKIKK